MQAPMQYGVDEWSPMMVKMTARLSELKSRHAQAQQRIQQATMEMQFLAGAIDDTDYMVKTWVSNAGMEKLMALAPPQSSEAAKITPAVLHQVSDAAYDALA